MSLFPYIYIVYKNTYVYQYIYMYIVIYTYFYIYLLGILYYTYIHTYIHACMHACMHTYAHVHTYRYMSMCLYIYGKEMETVYVIHTYVYIHRQTYDSTMQALMFSAQKRQSSEKGGQPIAPTGRSFLSKPGARVQAPAPAQA